MAHPSHGGAPRAKQPNAVAALLDVLPVVTIIAVIITIAGALVTIINPAALSFEEYLDAMKWLLGLLAVGRGVATYTRPGR
jgi:ABC-type transporter Mla maintaining outer membrane lipid asymmetry permease subunit MlaE